MEFRDAKSCYHSSGSVSVGSLEAASLYVDYIYLDAAERKRFAQMSHEYLIEQLQFAGDEAVSGSSNRIRLNLNHPVKELIWVIQPDKNIDTTETKDYGGPQWFNYTDAVDKTYYTGVTNDPLGGGMTSGSAFDNATIPIFTTGTGSTNFNTATNANAKIAEGYELYYDVGENPTIDAKLQLNGHDHMSTRPGRYFNLVQPYYHHTNAPATGINVYSFALNPEDHPPSGSCNMSRIDTAVLNLNVTSKAATSSKVRVFAINYNVLRVMSGMGGYYNI